MKMTPVLMVAMMVGCGHSGRRPFETEQVPRGAIGAVQGNCYVECVQQPKLEKKTVVADEIVPDRSGPNVVGVCGTGDDQIGTGPIPEIPWERGDWILIQSWGERLVRCRAFENICVFNTIDAKGRSTTATAVGDYCEQFRELLIDVKPLKVKNRNWGEAEKNAGVDACKFKAYPLQEVRSLAKTKM